MNLSVLLVISLLIAENAMASTFAEVVVEMASHLSVRSLENKARALKEEGEGNGSWGDPMFKVAAKNFPKDTFQKDQSPMTGIEFGVSQRIALTSKYGNIEDAYYQMSQAKKNQAFSRQRVLVKDLWLVLIQRERLEEQINITQENLNWISSILKVSKRLYANGRTSQQALLDIQIRKSELEAELSNKKYEMKEQLDKQEYLVGRKNLMIDEKTIPWHILDSVDVNPNDTKKISLEAELNAKSKMLTAKKLAYIPDVTISFGYTKRANIDNNGDFVSAAISFPLPFSGERYSNHFQATFEKKSAAQNLKNYERFKSSEAARLKHEIARIDNEFTILNEKIIRFAENSRAITSKSYSLGNSSYIELLQSELKLQKLLLKKSLLFAKLRGKKIIYKLLVGDKLYE